MNMKTLERTRADIMCDLETLGVDGKVAIIQFAAVAFDIDSGEIFAKFNEFVDINNSKALPIDGSTLIWWVKEPERRDLLAKILTEENRKSLKHVLFDFHEWVKKMPFDHKEKYMWGNGILFDNKIVEASMEENGLEYPFFYRNDRDVRTLVELVCMKEGITREELIAEYADESLVQHDAFDDCRFQVKLVCGCIERLTKGEIK